MYSTSVGTLVKFNNRLLLISEKGKEGYLLFGPYTEYGAGSYVVTFTLEVDGASQNEVVVCGRADVAVDDGTKILAQTSLYGFRLVSAAKISIPFHLHETKRVEFRVFTTGKFRMSVDPLPTIVQCVRDEARYCPVFAIGYQPKHGFVDSYFGDIRFLFENGAEISEVDDGVIGSFNGVKFFLTNSEDFQVVNEVFFANEYNAISAFKTVFIDIGMNTGMTSMFAAAKENVDRVYSFEPFNNPFNRAVRNFALNPHISDKISPFRFGMGSDDVDLEVIASPDSTIGTSIRGNNFGEPETITVRNAASVLSDIFSNAVAGKQAIIVKIDCEGSEFAIMQALEDGGLLTMIDVVMIEWHKWWSADLSQVNLVRSLLKAGFIVLDRTTPANIFAGMLYGIRRHPAGKAVSKRRKPSVV